MKNTLNSLQKNTFTKVFSSSLCQISAALLLAFPLAGNAASLGKITVFSAINEPLRAEVELTATQDELAGMRARLAAANTTRESGFAFSPTLKSVNFALDERNNGKTYIKLTSNTPITERFVDFMIELSWGSGRLVREYTFLLDPPNSAPREIAPTVELARAQNSLIAESPSEKAEDAPKSAARASATTEQTGDTYAVKNGDTLQRIAAQHKPDGVSLEQMLVALYRANQDAFAGKNMNRLKTGRILTIPKEGELPLPEAKEAKSEIATHTANWNAYRQKLAEASGASSKEEKGEVATQQSSGKITAKVEEPIKAVEESKDKLEVSRSEEENKKKAGDSATADEDKIAKEQAEKEAAERLAAEKDIAEKQQALEGLKIEAEKLAALEKAAAKSASAAEAAAKVEEVKVEEDMMEEAPNLSWQDRLAKYSEPIAVGGAVAALLVFMRLIAMRRKRKAKAAKNNENKDDAIKLPEADLMKSVEVYLTCGQIDKAEEVLLAAHEKAPKDHQITLKLLEIYVQQENAAKFEIIAKSLHKLTKGQGEVWHKAAQMGRTLAPNNSLYQAENAAPAASVAALEEVAEVAVAPASAANVFSEEPENLAFEPLEIMDISSVEKSAPTAFTEDIAPEAESTEILPALETMPEPEAEPELEAMDFDVMLDIKEELITDAILEEDPSSAIFDEIEPMPLSEEIAREDDQVQFVDLSAEIPLALAKEAESAPAPAPKSMPALSFDMESIDLNLAAVEKETPVAALATEEAQVENSMASDLSAPETAETPVIEDADADDIVATKLDLAKAYEDMGDKDGARELLQEILEEGSAMQIAATQQMLARLK